MKKITALISICLLMASYSCTSEQKDSKNPVLDDFWNSVNSPDKAPVLEGRNLFPDFKDDGGMLKGFVKKYGENTRIKINENDGGGELNIEAARQDTVYLDMDKPMILEKSKYLFSIDIKAENVAQKENKRCLIVYIYGNGDRHIWGAFQGSGSTKGWVNLLIPFDTNKDEHLDSIRLYIRCYDMSGILKFKNPMLVKLPESLNLKTQLRREDQTIIPSIVLSLEQEKSQL